MALPHSTWVDAGYDEDDEDDDDGDDGDDGDDDDEDDDDDDCKCGATSWLEVHFCSAAFLLIFGVLATSLIYVPKTAYLAVLAHSAH